MPFFNSQAEKDALLLQVAEVQRLAARAEQRFADFHARLVERQLLQPQVRAVDPPEVRPKRKRLGKSRWAQLGWL